MHGQKCAGKGGAKKIGGRVEGGEKLRELVFPGSKNGGKKSHAAVHIAEADKP